jgi:hypothetical protein
MVNMIEYIKTIIGDFPEEIIATRVSPATDHLFTVRDETEATPLPEEQACLFHHATAQVLFLSARARRDIQPCTTFLTTCVKSLDKDNWGKLKRLLGYLKGTLHMPLVLSTDSLTLLLVGGRGIRGAQQHEGTYVSRNELWSGHGSQLFLETQDHDE